MLLNQLLTVVPMPLKFCLELICSELFMLTSPANLNPLAVDYQNQVRHFSKGRPEKGWDHVIEDIKSLSNALAIGSGGLSDPRRSILVVPAATSRTADYWIAGQASLLASGTTTVFCNGVLKKALVGGSCFIGRESWKNGINTVGMVSSSTPYHGWSKGIYYNNPEDPLSEFDQAMVIADIDPFNMLEGKPRPQMLPVPLQLVAYLPIVETLDTELNSLPMLASLLGKKITDVAHLSGELIDLLKSKTTRPLEIQEITTALAQSVRSGNIDDQVFHLKELAEKFSDSDAMRSRAEAYERDRLQQPKSEPSPALYDWLAVDLTLRESEEIPKVMVPRWVVSTK